MATKFDNIALMVRRAVGDTHNKTTDALITDATEDGSQWTSAQVADEVNNAIKQFVYNLCETQNELWLARNLSEFIGQAAANVQGLD